jgi:hypothetical protein
MSRALGPVLIGAMLMLPLATALGGAGAAVAQGAGGRGYPNRVALAEERGAALALADACESELQPKRKAAPVCARYRRAMAVYMHGSSRRLAWCSHRWAQVAANPEIAAPPAEDCPDTDAFWESDPAIARFNDLHERLGLPPITAENSAQDEGAPAEDARREEGRGEDVRGEDAPRESAGRDRPPRDADEPEQIPR